MASSTGLLISRPNSPFVVLPSLHSSLQFRLPRVEFRANIRNSSTPCKVSFNGERFSPKLRAVAKDEEGANVVSGEGAFLPSPPAEVEAEASDQSVSVAVSPSDVLTMLFQAEGTMPDSSIPAVSTALKEVEGITDLKVQVQEGIASIELTKQTTVQATGVASNLVEIIQGSGFKLQSLNLSFPDEEDFQYN